MDSVASSSVETPAGSWESSRRTEPRPLDFARACGQSPEKMRGPGRYRVPCLPTRKHARGSVAWSASRLHRVRRGSEAIPTNPKRKRGCRVNAPRSRFWLVGLAITNHFRSETLRGWSAITDPTGQACFRTEHANTYERRSFNLRRNPNRLPTSMVSGQTAHSEIENRRADLRSDHEAQSGVQVQSPFVGMGGVNRGHDAARHGERKNRRREKQHGTGEGEATPHFGIRIDILIRRLRFFHDIRPEASMGR